MSVKMIVVQQYSSVIRRSRAQRAILRGLGLRRLNHVRQLRDGPAIRGMLAKLPHIVRIVEDGN